MARPIKRLTPKELRKLFNDGAYWERAQGGEFTERLERSHPISPRKRRKLDMPHGSLSQMVAYVDATGKVVARVHQYVRPDGRIREGSRPDPKYLLIDGVIHALHPRGAEGCMPPKR